jgi:anaerobic selenocysteine-containing dehydrogenase
MILPRREFLKLLGVAAGATGLGGCGQQWSVPDHLVELAQRGPGLNSHVQTICGMCEGACGLTVRLVDGLPVGLKGNPHHPLNRGGLCPVGHAALDVLYAPERIRSPLVVGPDGKHRPTDWNEALALIGERIGELRAAGDGGRIAFLSGEPGDLFHELAQQVALVLRSANVARQRPPETIAYRLTQGIDQVPGFDLARADLVLSFGSDLYEDGPVPLHNIAAMVGSRATGNRGALIHVGTRLSPSATKAELRVAIRSGTYAAFALGVGHVLVREGHYDRNFVEEHTLGFEDWTDDTGQRRRGFRRLLLERYYPDRVAQLCGCEATSIIEVARRFASASTPLALLGGEAAQGSNATWTAIAVHSLNALTGAFDRPGGILLPPPIPFTPLPPLTADTPDPGSSIFAALGGTPLFGVDPVDALASRVLDNSYPLDLLFVLNGDPVHDSPAGARLREAMEKIPMVVTMTPFPNETSANADIILPTHMFLEAWQGVTTPPTIAYSTLGVSGPVVEPLYDSRHPGDVLLELGREVDSSAAAALPWSSYEDYLRTRTEGLARSGQGAVVTGSFEDSWVHYLEDRGWRFVERRSPEGFWSELVRQTGWWNPVMPRGDWGHLFATPSGRYEFHSSALERRLRQLGAASSDASSGDKDALRRGIDELSLAVQEDEVCIPHFEPPREIGDGDVAMIPFRPLTARGSLGSRSPMLMEMFGYPVLSGWQTWAELAPGTAEELDLRDGDVVALESDSASIEAVLHVRPGASAGVIHVSLGLGHSDPSSAAGSIGANPLDVLLPDRDPLTGSLSLNTTRVRVRLVHRRVHGEPPPEHVGRHA